MKPEALVVLVKHRRPVLSPVEEEVWCRDLGSPRTPATTSLGAAAFETSVVVLDLCWRSSADQQLVMRLVRAVMGRRCQLERAAVYRQ
jgi:hypothetical protein